MSGFSFELNICDKRDDLEAHFHSAIAPLPTQFTHDCRSEPVILFCNSALFVSLPFAHFSPPLNQFDEN